ncbi:MAG: hypothetical protein A2X86_04695 [Bdellovibrionales bacterium GWA2_49_15]|nr:MAG: hypothetical protein A2X86_04695 [Bdellovibrionales bacterium GWA2_49_15]
MRLLTPDEIHELSTIFYGANSRPLVELLLERIDAETLEEICVMPEQLETKALESEKQYTQVSETDGEQKKGVVFILDLKKKLEKGQRALKEKEIFGLYQKAAGLDVDFSKANKDDLKKTSNLGVLINKKQY